MRTRRLLLAAVALTTALGACKSRPRYGNTKHPTYPDAPTDGSVDAAPDGAAVTPPTEPTP
jgi:hypothetical protein